jgi:hypothetical protein
VICQVQRIPKIPFEEPQPILARVNQVAMCLKQTAVNSANRSDAYSDRVRKWTELNLISTLSLQSNSQLDVHVP